jgi:hypothetical protein
MCNCHSYNMDTGDNPNIILYPPSHIGFTYPDGEPIETVCVDACIAQVIQHLWDNGVKTMNSCCGHGKKTPSIILEDKSTDEHAAYVRDLISDIDPRKFDLLSYRLVFL